MCWFDGPQPFGLRVSDANHHHSYRSSEDEGQTALFDTEGPRGTAVTISSDVSMLRPYSSQEARSETEGVTEG
ncbi:hypothetical protein E2C01_045377 [Portunus trituberculatus]|uniref:Uncharacterized protein n=1 Tax=Portunus trituberculatus TaxID=210409 RepID=A0A5B7FUU2_PORTR|nr:hypothetical protein [Portunus trituberculatus]